MTELEQLKAEDKARVFAAFSEIEALRLGQRLVELGLEARLPIVIDIRTPDFTLFHAGLPGSGPLNDLWARRKSNIALCFRASSLVVRLESEARGRGMEAHGLDSMNYAASGGAVPVAVRGAGVVACVTVSGMPDVEDHALVVRAMAEVLTPA